MEDDDIDIIMTMMNTKGDVHNSDFMEEIAKAFTVPTMESLQTDYTKSDDIGGILGITLDKNNSTVTKYNGSWYGKISRRWYGEVYIPASTVVAKSDTSVTDVARGVNTYKTGYILVTFAPIDTILADGTTSYLRYSTAHDPDGNDDAPYVMMDEKEGKADTVAIKLPNGVSIPKSELAKISANFYSEVAPIIIYDVSLRANNDYESSGTH